ncbi:hypothetical protein BK131_03410 [Paenibacillus amylolyticus]|uniref:Uncharacterized protein n=1 Tax=Paenibacillus amylolyticus TaxID=1451 RepID=A0A1R1C4J3_PAEAM|nr:hypothetical protein [Paenibacillus amylolyticus]OMF17035.1 hypothetical protein BK131_03410 [Paenibacillus amylolyticus]
MKIFALTLNSIVFISVIGLDIILYYGFLKFLREPFDELSPNRKIRKLQYKTIDSLYDAYKKLPKGKFKLAKMKIRAWQKPEFITQSIDFFMRIVISLLITTVGVSTTILIANLSFTNSIKTLHPDEQSWINSINKIFNLLNDGMSSYEFLVYIGTIIFFVAFANILILHLKVSLHKKHLIVIDEIEKEYSQR